MMKNAPGFFSLVFYCFRFFWLVFLKSTVLYCTVVYPARRCRFVLRVIICHYIIFLSCLNSRGKGGSRVQNVLLAHLICVVCSACVSLFRPHCKSCGNSRVPACLPSEQERKNLSGASYGAKKEGNIFDESSSHHILPSLQNNTVIR